MWGSTFRSSRWQMFLKRDVLKNFAFFTGKYPEGLQIYLKETPTQVFWCKYCEFLSTSFFIEHLWWLLLYIESQYIPFTLGNLDQKPLFQNGSLKDFITGACFKIFRKFVQITVNLNIVVKYFLKYFCWNTIKTNIWSTLCKYGSYL